jgi:uroporphyrinogen-III synthase
MRVLVTRPQADAAQTAARLAELGHEAIVEPLLILEPKEIDRTPAGLFAALAATSANAMRVAARMKALDPLRDLPLHAVGTHTADAAREARFKTVIDAKGDADTLAENIVRHVQSPGRVLHLAGEARAKELGPLLAARGIEVDVLELYRMRRAEKLDASAALFGANRIDVVLHFSPQSAATFVALVERGGLADRARRPRHLCLSQTVAAELMAIGISAEVAAEPNEAALLALLYS